MSSPLAKREKAYYVLVSFNDDGSASMNDRYRMNRAEAELCVARHNLAKPGAGAGWHEFAILSTDLVESRKLLDKLFPRLT